MNTKKILVSLIAAAAVACTMGVTASAAADDWDGTADTAWYTEAEAGTTAFTIDTAEELAGLATLVNDGNSFSGKTITLAESLDLAGYNWTPIGTEAAPFSGIFDGGKNDGIKISNLYIENTNPEKNKNYGLFGTIYRATLQNVYLDNVDITVTGKTGHNYYTGGLVGFANSYSEVKDSTKILNSTVTGNLTVSGRGCGGIVGYAFATTKLEGLTFGDAASEKSSLSIDASKRDLAYGGIVGYTYYVSAFNNLHMVNAEINGSTLTAGLIGWYNNDGASCNITNCSVTDSEINGANGTGGIVGLYNSPVSISSTTVENTEINGTEQKSGVFVGFYSIGTIDPNNVVIDEETCESIDNTGTASATTGVVCAATVNGTKYITIEKAIEAAEDGDVIIVSPGTYDIDSLDKLKIAKSITITGDPNYGTATIAAEGTAIDKPVLNISNVTNGGVEYHAPNVVFDNLVFNVLEDATGAGWNVSAIGYYYETVADRDGLTVTNCDFINNSDISMSAIAANISSYTITGNTFKNFTTMVHSYVDHGALGTVVISDNTFENVENIASVYWGARVEGETPTLTITNNKSTDDSTAKIIVDDFGKTKADPVTAIPTATITDNDGNLAFHNLDKNNDLTTDSPITYYYRTYEIAKSMNGSLPNGYVYVVNYIDEATGKVEAYENPVKYLVVDNKIMKEASAVELTFEENTADATALDNSVWDIYLNANQDGILNRLNSADFTFELTTDGKDTMAYEIIASNSEIVINNVNNDDNRYEFHYDGKTGTITDTATKIKIGTVKFTGYGAFTFKVDTTDVAENTNQVHTTTFADNIVDSFTVKGEIATVDNDGDLVVNGDNGIIDSEILVPTKTLTVNIDFPNSVSDNVVAYQQMKVVVSGGELEAPLTIDLGTDYTVSNLAVYDNKKAVAVSVTENNPYAIVITNLLEENTAYTVEVSGAGYRTAKYTVTMTEDKTLNFWNNVKDNAFEVEENKASSAKTVTFLAGDIVKDGNINIYDLSAVVSYFGEIELVEDNKTTYAKYDLNRDGKIDSKDVAYVLVSWGK